MSDDVTTGESIGNTSIAGTIVVRKISVAEFTDDVATLLQKYLEFYKVPRTLVEVQERFAPLLATVSVMLVAYLPGVASDGSAIETPVGLAHCYPQWSSLMFESNWLLNDLFVSSDVRDMGVGKVLIKATLAWAEEQGAFSMDIGTAVNNHRAQYLYPKMGFVEYNRYDDCIYYKFKFERSRGRVCPPNFE